MGVSSKPLFKTSAENCGFCLITDGKAEVERRKGFQTFANNCLVNLDNTVINIKHNGRRKNI